MTQPHIIKCDENLGSTMQNIMDHAVKTNAPVFCTVEGHGNIVLMSDETYAEMLDQIQTVNKASSSAELFGDDGGDNED